MLTIIWICFARTRQQPKCCTFRFWNWTSFWPAKWILNHGSVPFYTSNKRVFGIPQIWVCWHSCSCLISPHITSVYRSKNVIQGSSFENTWHYTEYCHYNAEETFRWWFPWIAEMLEYVHKVHWLKVFS